MEVSSSEHPSLVDRLLNVTSTYMLMREDLHGQPASS